MIEETFENSGWLQKLVEINYSRIKEKEYARSCAMLVFGEITSLKEFLKQVHCKLSNLIKNQKQKIISSDVKNRKRNATLMYHYTRIASTAVKKSNKKIKEELEKISKKNEKEKNIEINSDEQSLLNGRGFKIPDEEHVRIINKILSLSGETGLLIVKLYLEQFCHLMSNKNSFFSVLVQFTESGNVHYGILNYIFLTKHFRNFITDVKLIEKYFLLSPINVNALEIIVQQNFKDRDNEILDMLKRIKKCTTNQEFWRYHFEDMFKMKPNDQDYSDFLVKLQPLSSNNQNLISLRGPLPYGQALAYLHYTIKRRYVKNTINDCEMNDVAFTIISQHPSIKKKFICELYKYNDSKALYNWEHLNVKYCLFPHFFPFKEDSITKPYLNDDSFLSLPKNVNIIFCSSSEEIFNIIFAVKTADKNGFCVVGFDCEWSPIQHPQLVSLIQISFNNVCYLIDTIFGCKKSIKNLLETLFNTNNLMITGLQPQNDLKILLQEYTDIKVLYEPKHVFCLSTLIITINKHNSNKYNKACGSPSVAGNFDFLFPNWRNDIIKLKDIDSDLKEGNKNNVTIKCGDGDTEVLKSDENTSEFEKNNLDCYIENNSTKSEIDECPRNTKKKKEKPMTEMEKFEKHICCMGLSKLAKFFFEKELNKTEQSSVWNRRPLRRAQIQYAALDAEVGCMIFRKLTLLCQYLEIDIEKIVKELPSIVIGRPILLKLFEQA